MQIKTIVSYHQALVRIATIKKTESNVYDFPSALISISIIAFVCN